MFPALKGVGSSDPALASRLKVQDRPDAAEEAV
jgi:hypothetical protein